MFHRIAGSADASQLMKPLASRSAASSFESGRLETASNPSVRSVPDADAGNHITAQATSTDADSEADLHANASSVAEDEASLPIGGADLPPVEGRSPAQTESFTAHVGTVHAAEADLPVNQHVRLHASG